MSKAALFRFAGQCLALNDHTGLSEVVREKISSGEIHPDDLIGLCSNHLVIPALYLSFRNAGLLDLFPEEYLAPFQELFISNRERNLKILQQMEELDAMLDPENIPRIYLKGTGNLLDRVYSDIGERMIGDIDFMVPEKDVIKTATILADCGYLTPTQLYGYDFLDPDHHHMPHLTKKFAPACVEIHRIPVQITHSKKFAAGMVFREAKHVPGKSNVLVPSDRHKFILNFIHSQLSHSGHRKCTSSLRDLYDGYLLSKRVKQEEVLSLVEEKTKAEVYYHLINRTFVHTAATGNGAKEPGTKNPGPKNAAGQPTTISAGAVQFGVYSVNAKVERYIRVYDWWQEHPRWHRTFLKVMALFHLLFRSYPGKFIKAVYSRPHRRQLISSLSNPAWYKQHLLMLKRRFC